MNVGLRVVVPGLPVPQGSKSAKVIGRRAVLYDDNAAKLKPWRQLVTLSARRAMLTHWRRHGAPFERLDGPVEVDAVFAVPRPRSHYRTGRNTLRLKPSAPALPAVRPDLDKYARAALDALSDAGVWTDDGRVTDLHVRKRYAHGTPGLVIVARPALELVEAVIA